MTGTIVNAVVVVAGGLIGLLLKRGLSSQVEETAKKLVGLGVTIIGLNGVIVSMMTADARTGRLSDSGGVLLVLSLVIGGLLGEWMRLDDRILGAGLAIERRMGAEGFAKGFVSASLLFCIGAMSIVGALNDGLRGDGSVLYIKSALDGIMAIVLASSLGIGVPFAAVPILVYQGGISLCAGLLSPVLTGPLLDSICMVGYCIVLVIGANLLDVLRLKTANLLPALLIPVVYNLLMMLKNIW